MKRSILLSAAGLVAALLIGMGQNVRPAEAQTNEHPLPPPSVPESIAPKYYEGISFQDEYNYAGAAKQKLLDALNAKCLTAAARDAAVADAERAIHQIEEWTKYHPDEAARGWAGYWRGALQKYLAILKKRKFCPAGKPPPATQPTPPTEGGTPNSVPAETGPCEKPQDQATIGDLVIAVDNKKTALNDLKSKDQELAREIEDLEGKIGRLKYYIQDPSAERDPNDEDVVDPKTGIIDANAKIDNLKLERKRLVEDIRKADIEFQEEKNKLESLKEKEKENCPNDDHSSRDNPLNDALGHVSIGIGIGGHHERRDHRQNDHWKDDQHKDKADKARSPAPAGDDAPKPPPED